MAINLHKARKLGKSAVKPVKEESDKDEAKTALQEVVGRSREVLFSANTVFPFNLFPDTVTIDRNKFTITHRVFFRVAEVVSIQIEDILNVIPNIGPVFGSVIIHTRFFDPKKPYTINYLWRRDALAIDRIMHGYSIALKEDIDVSALETKELSKMLDKLGGRPNPSEA